MWQKNWLYSFSTCHFLTYDGKSIEDLSHWGTFLSLRLILGVQHICLLLLYQATQNLFHSFCNMQNPIFLVEAKKGGHYWVVCVAGTSQNAIMARRPDLPLMVNNTLAMLGRHKGTPTTSHSTPQSGHRSAEMQFQGKEIPWSLAQQKVPLFMMPQTHIVLPVKHKPTQQPMF